MKQFMKNMNIWNEMRRTILVLFTFSMIGIGNQTVAQNTVLSKAQKAYSLMQYDVAAKLLENYFQQDGSRNNIDLLMQLADSYWKMREYTKAESVYEEINLLDSSRINDTERIRISNMEARNWKYQNAAKWLEGLSGYEARQLNFINKKITNAASAESDNWDVKPLNINTKYREFSPVLVNDYLLFTSNSAQDKVVKANGWDGDNYTKLWKAKRSDIKMLEPEMQEVSEKDSVESLKIKNKRLAGVFEDADTKPAERKASGIANLINNLQAISPGLASMVKGLEGVNYNVASASVDLNNNFYFSGNRKIEKGEELSKLMIYQGKYDGEKVTDIFPLDIPGATFDNLMHPAVSKDGTKLIFAGNKDGGTYDLYLLERNNADEAWSDPVKLSTSINTVGNEVFPTIDDNGSLYFSSDGNPGYGGLDIYKVALSTVKNDFADVELMPEPVNSTADDFGFVAEQNGENGYFTSDRDGENDNIYSFVYDPYPKTVFVSGLVKEKKTREVMPGATVFVYNKTTNEVMVDKADNNGAYQFELKNPGEYLVKAVEANYKDDCNKIQFTTTRSKEAIISVPDLLPELTYKNVWILENLLYDFDKWNIRKDAEPPLDSLVTILKKYPIKVELGSHTDSRGSFKYNETLSQKRAESAVKYIVSKGISKDRITAKGYGEYRLKNKCADGVECTEEEHQQNRRTEITVTYNPAPANSVDPNKYKKGQKLTPANFPANFFDDCK